MPNLSGDHEQAQTTRTLIWAVVALFATDVAAVAVVVALGGPETIVVSLLGQLPVMAAVMLSLRSVEQVKRDTADLRNGLLDAKVRAGVADVLPDHLVDPDYRTTGQYRRDDERRGTEH